MRRAIEAVGAQLWFLPKYSPDFNPIELAFAKLKAILRKARCRTREVLRFITVMRGWPTTQCSSLLDGRPTCGFASIIHAL